MAARINNILTTGRVVQVTDVADETEAILSLDFDVTTCQSDISLMSSLRTDDEDLSLEPAALS